jgi:hypothetical protein
MLTSKGAFMAILRQMDLDFFLDLEALSANQDKLEYACDMLGLNRCKICNKPATSKDPEQNLTNLHYCPDHILDFDASMKELDERLEKIIHES